MQTDENTTKYIGIILLIGLIVATLVYTIPPVIDLAYASAYGKEDAGFTTIVLTTPDQYLQLKDMNMSYSKNFIFQDSNIIAQTKGTYKVSFSASVTASNNGEIGSKLFINHIGQNNCYAHRDMAVGKTGNAGFNCIIDLNVGDYVNVQFDDHANPTATLTFESANLAINQIG